MIGHRMEEEKSNQIWWITQVEIEYKTNTMKELLSILDLEP